MHSNSDDISQTHGREVSEKNKHLSFVLTKQSKITHMFSSIIKFPLIEIKKVGEGETK